MQTLRSIPNPSITLTAFLAAMKQLVLACLHASSIANLGPQHLAAGFQLLNSLF